MDKRFLDIDGVCEFTSLSKSTIYKRVMNQTIPFCKVGKRILFDKEQVSAWILSGGQMVEDIPAFKNFLS